jgi:hypothetical protein
MSKDLYGSARQMCEEEYPRVKNLLCAYFNQDWMFDYPDW